MRYSMWSSYLRGSSPEECVRVFSQKGWYFLELSTEHGETLLTRGEPERVGRDFLKFAADYGVAFPQGHLLLSADIAAVKQDETLDTLKRWLDLFNAVGVKNSVLHCGGLEMDSLGKPESEINEARIKALRILCDHIKPADMFICLENLARFTTDAESLKSLITSVGSDKLAICLDTGHLNMRGLEQPEFIEKAGVLLKALHIADNEGKADQHLMPYGKGTIKWNDFIFAIAKSDYDGLLNFEIPGESANCPPEMLLYKLDYIREIALDMLAKINSIRSQRIHYV